MNPVTPLLLSLQARLICEIDTAVAVRFAGAAGGGGTTGSVIAFDMPPPGVGFTTVMLRFPTLARSAAVSITANWLPLVKVVVREAPFTCACETGTNPLPLTVTFPGALP